MSDVRASAIILTVEARTRNLLVLDAGGVLVTEPIPQLLADLASAGTLSLPRLERFYYGQLYEPLWSGSLSTRDFWGRLIARSGASGSAGDWEREFLSRLRPTFAVGAVEAWRGKALIFVLSNHRRAWLEPVLEDAGIDSLIDDLLISEELGVAKPDPAAFECLLARVPSSVDRLLFADDAQANVDAAQAAGIPSLLVEDGADWVDQVTRWCGGHRVGDAGIL